MSKVQRRPLKFLLLAATVLNAGMGLTPVAAMASDEAATDSTQVSEMVVTARKRTEDIKDVPISISVLSGATLEARGVTNIDSLQRITTGFTYVSDYNGRAAFTIRGAGSSLDPALPVGVGVFVDGVSESNPGFLGVPLFDVDQIAILKGPQSTLYGQNTLAGAVSITTRLPSEKFESAIRAEYASGNSRSGAAMISGPIYGDTLFARFSIGGIDRDGYFKYRDGHQRRLYYFGLCARNGALETYRRF